MGGNGRHCNGEGCCCLPIRLHLKMRASGVASHVTTDDETSNFVDKYAERVDGVAVVCNDANLRCLTRQAVNTPHPAMQSERVSL
jgi:hypothetical protein